MEELVIKMYKQGISINGIVDRIFKVNKKLVPTNNSYKNYSLYEDRKYNRLDCLAYVSRVILNYNRFRLNRE